MHGLIFETSVCYWQNQPGCYLYKLPNQTIKTITNNTHKMRFLHRIWRSRGTLLTEIKQHRLCLDHYNRRQNLWSEYWNLNMFMCSYETHTHCQVLFPASPKLLPRSQPGMSYISACCNIQTDFKHIHSNKKHTHTAASPNNILSSLWQTQRSSCLCR